MPDITISVSDAALAKAHALRALYNETNGTSLTTMQWAKRMLALIIMGPEIEQAAAARRIQAVLDERTATDADREALLSQV